MTINQIKHLMTQRPNEAVKLIQAAITATAIAPRRLDKRMDFKESIGKGGVRKFNGLVAAVNEFAGEDE